MPIWAGAQANPVFWLIRASPPLKDLKPGDRFRVEVVALMEEGWHIYSLTQPLGGPIPTRITLPGEQPFKLAGPIQGPPPKTKFEDLFGINTEWHEGKAVFSLPVQVD